MKLFVITSNPSRASFRQRIELHLSYLNKCGINCDVASFPKQILSRWKLLKRSSQYDAVFLHKKRLNWLDGFWLNRYAKKIIYDFDDAVMYNDKKPEKFSYKRQSSFKRTVKFADLIIAGNDCLADHAKQYSNNVHVLPTGLKISDYNQQPMDIPKNNGIRLVWIGSKSTLPYLAGIKDALEEIGNKYENVSLRIICDDFFDLQNMPIEKCRWSRKHQAEDLAACDIGLAPLTDDPFSRGKCGFKILQYAATGLAVVASPVGVNKKFIEDAKIGFLACDTSEWVEKLSTLIEDEQLRTQMGSNARMYVKQFDIEAIAQRLCVLIQSLIEGR